LFVLVEKIWNKPCKARTTIDKIQQKLKLFKQYFKGWGFNLQGEMRKKRKEYQRELSALESIEEDVGLSVEADRKMWLLIENLKSLEQEEMYWYERSHENWLLKGDSNISYFHKCANGRKRNNNIISLEKDGQIIEGDENLLKHASEYYSDLFGPPIEYDIQMDPDIWENIPKVSQDDNELLCKPFSEKEVKDALDQMEENKAARPDKIPIEFYQSYWHIVKDDVVQLFDDFFNQKVNSSRVNYGVITLLPKIKDALKIQQFRLFCLLNCLYKLVTVGDGSCQIDL
jgi:hypothetical protein